ncbi:unnamed protein product [Effrenium voratum]|uniref:BUB1 N-terminal domain-containing protein n=1 Tax=Effrenium voratum TaxID=2562239 RepID=A0AA36IGZ8_9DINO|nr:unnamed protein product [Effrenium voratum]
MLATASGRLHCQGLPLPPANGKENAQDFQSLPRNGDQHWQAEVEAAMQRFNQINRQLLDTSPERPRPCDADGAGKSDLESARQSFEMRLQSRQSDVVSTWCEYVQWVAESCGDESKVLARACYALAGEAEHRDDIRHLRLWVRHAGQIPQAEQVFDYLEAEGIGTRHALLYEACAAHLERQRAFAEAECQYELGLARRAEPQERLRSRFNEFRRRMSKRAAREERRKNPALIFQEPSKQRSQGGSTPGELERSQVDGPEELPIPGGHVFIPISSPGREVEVEPEGRGVFRAKDGEEAWKGCESRAMTTELTGGLRALLAESRFSHGRSSRGSTLDLFEDPTYTAELAKREVLGLLAFDSHEKSSAPPAPLKTLIRVGAKAFQAPRSSGAFEVFEETDFVEEIRGF